MTVFWITGIIFVLLIGFTPLKNPEPTPKRRHPLDVLFPGIMGDDPFID